MKLSKETLKRIIKEELEAVMNEGDRPRRSKHDIDPLRDMGWEFKGKTSTIVPGDPTETQEEIAKILMFDADLVKLGADLRISQASMAARKITEDEGLDLTDYLTNTLKIPADQVPRIAEKIMKEINQ